MYYYRVPTLRNEILFAEQCISDQYMADFERQQSYAQAYETYVFEQIANKKSEGIQKMLLRADINDDHDDKGFNDFISVQRSRMLQEIRYNVNTIQPILWSQKLRQHEVEHK